MCSSLDRPPNTSVRTTDVVYAGNCLLDESVGNDGGEKRTTNLCERKIKVILSVSLCSVCRTYASQLQLYNAHGNWQLFTDGKEIPTVHMSSHSLLLSLSLSPSPQRRRLCVRAGLFAAKCWMWKHLQRVENGREKKSYLISGWGLHSVLLLLSAAAAVAAAII